MKGSIKRSRWFAIVLFGWLVLALPAQGTSFDCAKAQSKVEKMICADAELSRLDEELTAFYKTVLQDEKQAETIRQTQKQWMKERNGCSDVACVRHAYEVRVSSLTAKQLAFDVVEATKQKAAPQTGKPLYGHCIDVGLAGSCGEGQSGKGYAVCEVYLTHLNALKDTPKCEALVPPGFKHPDWEEMDVLKYLPMAYQAEAIYLANYGGYKHPDFETWRRRFLEETQAGRIAPQMLKTRVQPLGEKTITLLAYTRDRAGCQNAARWPSKNSYWPDVGYIHFLLLDDPVAALRVIEGGLDSVSKHQTELLLYANKPYFVRRFSFSTDMSIIAFDLKMTNISGKAASINAAYAKLAPGTAITSAVVDSMKQLEPDSDVYWAGQLCNFSPVNHRKPNKPN